MELPIIQGFPYSCLPKSKDNETNNPRFVQSQIEMNEIGDKLFGIHNNTLLKFLFN